jgi:hypothetical protein
MADAQFRYSLQANAPNTVGFPRIALAITSPPDLPAKPCANHCVLRCSDFNYGSRGATSTETYVNQLSIFS